ncbi:nuclear cap-binding protein subunit 2 [Acrasis kona]|uniref:Nuclear cap-binding protein subunit 2 n=1 Tax=Acrasis kona TaxID=1008807 RepID=A0AAW2ZR87_9EUKA
MERPAEQRSPPTYRREGSPDRSRQRSPSPARNESHPSKEEAIAKSTTLFVGNLPFNIRDKELEDIFSKHGKVAAVKVGYNPRTGSSCGYGFVEYEERADAEQAFKNFDQYELYGRKLRLDWDLGKDKKRQLGEDRPRRQSRGYGGRTGDYHGGGGYGGGYAPYPRGGGYGGAPYDNYRDRGYPMYDSYRDRGGYGGDYRGDYRGGRYSPYSRRGSRSPKKQISTTKKKAQQIPISTSFKNTTKLPKKPFTSSSLPMNKRLDGMRILEYVDC